MRELARSPYLSPEHIEKLRINCEAARMARSYKAMLVRRAKAVAMLNETNNYVRTEDFKDEIVLEVAGPYRLLNTALRTV